MSSSTDILTGGSQITVTDLSGQSHSVLVRLLKIKEFPDYFANADDEEALAAFVTDKDAEFVASPQPGGTGQCGKAQRCFLSLGGRGLRK